MSNVWKEKVGSYGNTVTVREASRGGNVRLEAWDSRAGFNRTKSLGFPVRDAEGKLVEKAVKKAREKAIKASNRLRLEEVPFDREEAAEAGRIFDRFRREQIADDLSETHRADLKRQTEGMERFLGRSFDLSDRDAVRRKWRDWIRLRTEGKLDARGRRVPASAECPDCAGEGCEDCDGTGRIDPREPVAPSTAAKALRALRQVCKWAVGEGLLEADPTAGLDLPRNPDPRREAYDDAEYEALLEAAPEITMGRGEEGPRAPILEILVLVGFTGRRIGAVLALRWADWYPDRGAHGELRWRAEEDKVGREWRAPVTPEVYEALENLRRERLAAEGEMSEWIFPAPRSKGHLRSSVARSWLLKAEKAAGVEHVKGRGFHGFRRRWVSKRKHLPRSDVAWAGGWKDPATLDLYEKPDPESLEEVVMEGRRFRLEGEASGSGSE